MARRFMIVGGTDMDLQARAPALPTPEDVHREARRRLGATQIETARMRAKATGGDMPKAAHYLVMQIEFAASALATLRPIPDDFSDDIYWPR
jgi:hypothetical protein